MIVLNEDELRDAVECSVAEVYGEHTAFACLWADWILDVMKERADVCTAET